MTLPSSGSITTAQIAAEVGGYPFSIPSTPIRNLTGRSTGDIIMPTHFYGQTGGGYCVFSGSDFADTVAGIATMTAVPFGATAWNRRIFCIMSWACTANDVETTIASATIGGVAATLHRQSGEGGTSDLTNYGCAITSATVPTGASGTIVVTFTNGTARRAYCSAYRVTGLVSATAFDATAGYDEIVGAGAVNASDVCSVPSNGLLFVAAVHSSFGTLPGITFTGATEQLDSPGAFSERRGHAMSTGLGSQTNRPVGAASSSTVTNRMRMVAASFQLA